MTAGLFLDSDKDTKTEWQDQMHFTSRLWMQSDVGVYGIILFSFRLFFK